jgi:hypothetical protein
VGAAFSKECQERQMQEIQLSYFRERGIGVHINNNCRFWKWESLKVCSGDDEKARGGRLYMLRR